MTKAVTDPIHPGEILAEEFMKPADINAVTLAKALRIPLTRVRAIVGERESITADTAMRLGRYFSTTSEFWMNLQRDYELRVAGNSSRKQIERDVAPMNAA